MFISAIFIAATAFAPAIFAAPTAGTANGPAARQVTASFNCEAAYNNCVAKPYAVVSTCEKAKTDCQQCVATETTCRNGADYSKQIQCTTEAQQCFFEAENPATLDGEYSCDNQFYTCKHAPLENNAFCASQNSGCESCKQKEEECRTAPEANQSFCSSQVAGCYAGTTSLN